MGLHRNARLGLAGPPALVLDGEAGCSCREAARRRGVSPGAVEWQSFEGMQNAPFLSSSCRFVR